MQTCSSNKRTSTAAKVSDAVAACGAGSGGDHRSKLRQALLTRMFDDNVMELLLIIAQHAHTVRLGIMCSWCWSLQPLDMHACFNLCLVVVPLILQTAYMCWKQQTFETAVCQGCLTDQCIVCKSAHWQAEYQSCVKLQSIYHAYGWCMVCWESQVTTMCFELRRNAVEPCLVQGTPVVLLCKLLSMSPCFVCSKGKLNIERRLCLMCSAEAIPYRGPTADGYLPADLQKHYSSRASRGHQTSASATGSAQATSC